METKERGTGSPRGGKGAGMTGKLMSFKSYDLLYIVTSVYSHRNYRFMREENFGDKYINKKAKSIARIFIC